jgi:hypothetical protein
MCWLVIENIICKIDIQLLLFCLVQRDILHICKHKLHLTSYATFPTPHTFALYFVWYSLIFCTKKTYIYITYFPGQYIACGRWFACHFLIVIIDVTSLQCDICGMYAVHMDLHKTRVHSAQSYPCDVCQKQFARRDSLMRHKKHIHNLDRIVMQ